VRNSADLYLGHIDPMEVGTVASSDPERRAAILRNAQAAERERLRNQARIAFPDARGEELEKLVDELEREKLRAAGKRGAAVVRTRSAQARRFQAQHAILVEQAECLLDLLREVGPVDPRACEHAWPDELTPDAACGRCCMAYADWSEPAGAVA